MGACAENGGSISEGVGQTEVEDWRRLRACPGCDYSLETLPAEGVCPECGRGYDQRYIVLTGLARGRWDDAAGGTWRGTAGQAVWIVVIVLVFTRWRRAMADPQMIGWGVVGTVALAMQWYARLFSAREPRTQLWLSPDGVAQVASTPEARRAKWVSANIWWLFLPILLAVILFQNGLRPGAVSWFVIGVLIFGALLWWWSRRLRSGGSDSDAYKPVLWPWNRIERIQVATLPRERARVRCWAMRKWGRIAVNREWVIDIEVPCTAKAAESLGRQMVAWSPKAKADVP